MARLSAKKERVGGDLDGLPAAVTFDCWNTLIYEEDWTVAHAGRVDALRAAAAEGGHHVDRAEAERAFNEAWGRHMALWRAETATGALEVAAWALDALRVAPAGIPFDHLVHDWQEASHSGRVVELDGARATLEELARSGVRIALICDTGLTPGRVVRHHLGRLGLLAHLEMQIFSDEVGVPKPSPRVFRAALASLEVEPERSVHVGDLRRTDVAGARAVGMGTVRLRARHDDTSELPEADAVADDYAHLRSLLGLGGA